MQISNIENVEKKDFFHEVVEQTNAIGNEINYALKSLTKSNQTNKTLSTTAKIEASRLGDAGKDFLVVSHSIDELSIKTKKVIEKMHNESIKEIDKLATEIKNKSVILKGNRLTNLALTNIRLVDRSLFERAADIRWWATDDIIVQSLSNNDENVDVEDRLAIMLKSYSVYYDLILCDVSGNYKATGKRKSGMSGRNFCKEKWFKNAMNTKDGTEYGFQKVQDSPIINKNHTIMFSCKVHENGDPKRKVIGILASVFNWEEFAQRIVNETALKNEEKANTRVLICDDFGNVLSDSKEKILQEPINLTGQTNLFGKDKKFVFEKDDDKIYLVAHALSPGFEGYRSSEWHSLIIQDLDVKSFDVSVYNSSDNDDSFDSVTGLVLNLSDETQKAITEINEINDQTHVLSLNAAIEATRVGDKGKAFGVISGFMAELSELTANITNSMYSKTKEKIENLNEFITTNSLQIKGDRLSNLSFTNIDLIDRALFERAADVRWWATDNSIVKTLSEKTENNVDFLSSRLRIILQYYTVYEDLMIYDNEGNIITSGSNSNILGNQVADSNWFENVKKTRNGEKFSFDLIKTKQDGEEKIRLVFSCKVHRTGKTSEESIGVLAIVFKWEQFAETIFDETPLNDSEKKNTSLLITDGNGDFLAYVDRNNDKIKKETLLPILKETKNFDLISNDDMTWLSGHAKSVGYEGFSTEWHALIIQPEIK